jgi:hypothetical protein
VIPVTQVLPELQGHKVSKVFRASKVLRVTPVLAFRPEALPVRWPPRLMALITISLGLPLLVVVVVVVVMVVIVVALTFRFLVHPQLAGLSQVLADGRNQLVLNWFRFTLLGEGAGAGLGLGIQAPTSVVVVVVVVALLSFTAL